MLPQWPNTEVTNPGCQVAMVPNICGTAVWNVFHVTIPEPTILNWLPDFCEVCATLA